MNTSGKVALVTGGGTGVGSAVALALAREGYRVVVAGRREATLATTVAKRAAEDVLMAVPVDVRDPSSVMSLFAAVKKEFGRLDLLFNNAGIGAPMVPLEEIPYEVWVAVVETNLTGAFLWVTSRQVVFEAEGVILA